MAPREAWWLNLDAERELADPEGYAPKPATRARIDALLPQLRDLLGPDALVLGSSDIPVDEDVHARAWCPTPRAEAAVQALGLSLGRVPSLDVLQRVNGRPFCAQLGQTLEGAREVGSMEALNECITGATPTGDWVIKRPYGFAGKERRRAIGGRLDASTAGFARSGLQRWGSLQVEPWVERTLDVAQHGWVRSSGEVSLAPPVVQQCSDMGQFERAVGDARPQLREQESRLLTETAQTTGEALHKAGYFGPYGIDGYRYLRQDGSEAFNPRSEINARFSMAYRWPAGVRELPPSG